MNNITQIVEASYLAGFEPSSDGLSSNELYSEANDYLIDLTNK